MKILSSYGLFLLLTAACAVTAGIGLTAFRLNTSADRALADISTRAAVLNAAETEEKIAVLNKTAENADLFIFSESDARKWFLDALDTFLKKYDAKVISPMQKTGSAFRSRVSFRFTPKTPGELATLLEYMENSAAPVFIIESTAFISTDREKYINVTAEIIQPFYGGGE
ncbi:hypothetical protein EP073_00020 [Geovibrio thiophilus]|uniref:Uncharacterized protein n=1 Tax=Geovibrio thiophilus TaxID=139438 RepID=A0A410JUH2_9BACT|nr:hypothetical protein [Geovibrio thiophilus]QAR31844.1 hypothetical protein EP073_00020 [Geovibrio thiophilus]